MKRLVATLVFLTSLSASVFADFFGDIRSFIGKRVELTLANSPKSIAGVLATSEMMGNIMALVITNENGEKVLVFLGQIAAIREVKQASSN